MIETVSDIVASFAKYEKRRLDEFQLKHGPTIGAMYEGLAQEILKRSLPAELGLDVVSGFIVDNSGTLSSQLDCMLVRGQGEHVPYTASYKWHVRDVVAVLEVKKTLYSSDIADSHNTLSSVLDRYRRHVADGLEGDSFNISNLRLAFSRITGRVCPSPDSVSTLPVEMQMIYHSLIVEQFSPVRIAVGFDGFKSEKALRDGFCGFISKNMGLQGFGPSSFPQLIISGQYSIAKLNGQPFCVRSPEGWWHCFGSSRADPLRLMLEYIWTRLARDHQLMGLWGDDLDCEGFFPLVQVQARASGSTTGWVCSCIDVDEATLANGPPSSDWEPTPIGTEEFVIINRLASGNAESQDDSELLDWLRENGRGIEEITESLLSTRLVALDGNSFTLLEDCAAVALPDGRFVVAETGSGRLARWAERFMKRWQEKTQSETVEPA